MITMAQIICRQCRRVLGSVINETGASYVHSMWDQDSGVDHDPIPVVAAPGETLARCDFCQDDTPHPWLLPTKAFTFQGVGSDPGWAACDTCASLIGKHKWSAIISRAVAASRRVNPSMVPGMRRMLVGLYQTILRNQTGPLIPPEASAAE